jgi:glycosyltransferase involved in cell wall biosynthesis
VIGDLFQRINGLVVISEGLEERWRTFTSAPILVAPDGVDIDRFEDGSGIPVPNRPETSPSRQVATYAGSLKGWKGVDTLIEAAGFVPDVEVWILGGTALQHQRMEEASGPFPPNVQMIERVNPAEVPKYLAASDVLVLPNTAEQRISQQYTSPLKLFEYMAMRRPIVASEIPSLTEILDNSCAYFAVPDDPESFGKTIRQALDDPEAEQKAEQAREAVKKYSWLRRAQMITDFLEQED